MSGICALLDRASSTDPSLERLRHLAAAAPHRATKDATYWLAPRAFGMAHLERSNGTGERQPQSRPNRRFVAAIDSRLEHPDRLLDGLRDVDVLGSRVPGDAELALAAYERWVEDAPLHLEGDFALLVWDQKREQLFCARDRLGVRPLYWTRDGSALLFASEATQLAKATGTAGSVDRRALLNAVLGLDDEPQRSFLEEIHRLPPGHFMLFRPAGRRLQDYRESAARPSHGSRLPRLPGRGPVAIVLDGSEQVAALARRLSDEVDREVIEIIHPLARPDLVPAAEAPSLADQPHAGSAAAETLLHSELAAAGATVVLTPLRARARPPGATPGAVPQWLAPETAVEFDVARRLVAAAERPATDAIYPGVPTRTPLARCFDWLDRLAASAGIELVHPLLREAGGAPTPTVDEPSPVGPTPELAVLGLIRTDATLEGGDATGSAARIDRAERWLAERDR